MQIVKVAALLFAVTVASVAKGEVIVVHLTFHDARPNRQTALGIRQNARMAAINRAKTHRLMGRKIIPFAYRDKKTGKKIFDRLSSRRINDITCPRLRRKSEYHLDYYINGQVTGKYQKYNNTIWYCKL